MLIDTHCHLNDSEAFPDPGEAVAEAWEAGVTRLLVVGIDSESCRRALDLADQFPGVYAIVGRHPNSSAGFDDAALRELEEMMSHPRVVALGEIGLDFYWDFATPDEQRSALLAQLELARRVSKPVVIHCRDAYPQLLDILEREPRHPILFHCFMGDAQDARRALELGASFGVDGPITYKSAHPLREVLAQIPLDRMVVETDAPYMTPVPHRGKRNRPAYVRFVNAALAELHGVSESECARITTANAERFFGLTGDAAS
jgi:TatD DNase family protein